MLVRLLLSSSIVSLALLVGCAYPESLSGATDKNALGYPEAEPLRVYRPVACDGQGAGADAAPDEYRYYVFEIDGQLRLYEYRGPGSKYMTYTTNGWTKGGEDIFFTAEKAGRTKMGQLFALPRGEGDGVVTQFVGGRQGLKLKIEARDGRYMVKEGSSAIGTQCLRRADDEPFPPAFAGPPPWAGFYKDKPGE